MNIGLSLVVPVYNEEAAIEKFHTTLRATLDTIKARKEIIYINDGSKDLSLSLLEKIKSNDPEVMVINFRKNFGQTAAMQAGFDHAQGDIVVTLDADLQNDPHDIPLLLDNFDNYDVLCGWRFHRKDPFLTRILPSRIANAIISWATGVKLHDYGCSLKAFRKEIAKEIEMFGDMHRFIPALASWKGARIGEIKVTHHKRTLGTSKYGISRTIPVILDLITVKFFLSFSKNPMRIFGSTGMGSFAVGIAILLYFFILKVFCNQPIWGRPLVLLGILLLILGVQLIAIGLLGEMLSRIYYSKKQHSLYSVKE